MQKLSDRLIAIFALAVFAASLFIIAWKVPSPDLIIVILLAIGFAAYDLYSAMFKRRGK